MLRVTMIMLCFLLAAAAAGRYQAEVDVRETRREIRELDRLKLQEESQIQVLRSEVAYLESPERLARIAAKTTDLRPLSAAQLMTAEDFVLAFGQPSIPSLILRPGAEPAPARLAATTTDAAFAE